MTDEQKAAFINSQVACANIEALAMGASNLIVALRGEYPEFEHSDFMSLIDSYQIDHNSVIGYFRD